VYYLVGSPRGRLTQLEKAFLTKPWEDVRESVQVKLIEHVEETYVLARSQGRRDKEQSMRRRRLEKLVRRLRELQRQDLTRDDTIAQNSARPRRRPGRPIRCWSSTRDEGSAGHIGNIPLRAEQEEITAGAAARRQLFAAAPISRGDDPRHLWRLYLQLVEVEQAFKEIEERSVDPSPSITSSKPESKPIFSLRFWPTVCWSR